MKRFYIAIICLSLLFIPQKVLYQTSYSRSPEGAIKLPIIMYHQVKKINLGKDVISPSEFESDLKYLVDNNYMTITMTQLIDYVYYNKELPEKPIILSFDDGYLNNYKYVLPLLKKYKIKIVLSVIGKNVDDFTQISDDNIDYSHANWFQLKEMIESGYVEVQNHSYNLHCKAGRNGCMQLKGETLEHYQQVLKEDIGKFQEEIYLKIGQRPNTFTYPYGGFNKNTDSILMDLGFKATLSCKYGINLITKDPKVLFDLKRICRSHGNAIGKLIDEAMKTIK